jgi:hypothetical protein
LGLACVKTGSLVHKATAAAMAVVLSISPVIAQPSLQFRQLPKEAQEHANEVRNSCKAENPDITFSDMQGIQVMSLSGDRSNDAVMDNEGLCGAHLAGANCSNRGCDMTIYKEISKGRWRKIFQEHLYEKFLAIDWKTMRLQLMVVSISANDAKCQSDPRREYTSGDSCNLIVTYKTDNWNWSPIR